MSNLFTLNSKDFVKGLTVAVLAAVFTTVAQWLNAPGFDFATFDWGELGKVAAAATMAYLAKNFFSDKDGRVLGRLG